MLFQDAQNVSALVVDVAADLRVGERAVVTVALEGAFGEVQKLHRFSIGEPLLRGLISRLEFSQKAREDRLQGIGENFPEVISGSDEEGAFAVRHGDSLAGLNDDSPASSAV